MLVCVCVSRCVSWLRRRASAGPLTPLGKLANEVIRGSERGAHLVLHALEHLLCLAHAHGAVLATALAAHARQRRGHPLATIPRA